MTDYNVNRTALIDGDFIAYQLAAWAHANQADQFEMARRIEEMFEDWMRRSCCTGSLVAFSCSRDDNFRRDHYPLYKTNRTSEPPAMLNAAKAIVADQSRPVYIDRLEADDILGILATNGKIENPVIITVDKDLRQIPGWHFNPDKEDFPVRVSEVEADYVFYTQWLTGDSTDGFGGIKGCGPKKAAKLLNTDYAEGLSHEENWCALAMDAYMEAGMTQEQALAQARCARILRASDFDSERREPLPWTWEGIGLSPADAWIEVPA
jgi:DNA polymerase-1